MNFAYRIGLFPILAQFSGTFAPKLIEPDFSAAAAAQEVLLACHASVLKARGFEKREAVALLNANNQRTVRQLHAKRRRRTLCDGNEQVLLGRALAWIELRVVSPDGQLLEQCALPLLMMKNFDTLLVLLKATDAGQFGAMKALRSMVKLPEHMSPF